MAALCVSSLFWTILFPQIKKTSIVDVHCHGINTVAILLDLAISPLPYFLKHGYEEPISPSSFLMLSSMMACSEHELLVCSENSRHSLWRRNLACLS